MATVPELIQSWRRKELTGTQLMRSLVSHRAWSVPVSESAASEMLATNEAGRIQYSRDEHGKNRLLLFSSDGALESYHKASGPERGLHFLTTTGAWVFRLPLDGTLDAIDEIWIDPFTADDVFYGKEQFPMLRVFAGAVSIEEDISALRQGTAVEGAVVRVREYGNYVVAVAKDDSGHQSLMLAPDSQGRPLAAVFTAIDSYDAFFPEAQAMAPGKQVSPVALNGKTLFGILAGMNLTGIVFNCSGPVKPVAFAAQFATVVLEA